MDTHTYHPTDWKSFEDYSENTPDFTGSYHGHAYITLRDLLQEHTRTKVASPHTKLWWDEEVSVQLKVSRKALPESYIKERKKLQRFIRDRKGNVGGSLSGVIKA